MLVTSLRLFYNRNLVLINYFCNFLSLKLSQYKVVQHRLGRLYNLPILNNYLNTLKRLSRYFRSYYETGSIFSNKSERLRKSNSARLGGNQNVGDEIYDFVINILQLHH